MNIEIKRITITQIDDLVELFDLYMVFYKKPSNKIKYKQYLQERIKNKEATIFMAYDNDNDNDNKPIGFVLNYHSFSSVILGKIIVLNDLFVVSAYRKKGVANKLIDCTINLAKEIGALRIDLKTAKDNFTAQPLYEKIGFIKDTIFFSYNLNL